MNVRCLFFILLTGCPFVVRVGTVPDAGGVCISTTCAARAAPCGMIDDGCGGVVDCGRCEQQCTPKSCQAQGRLCGFATDGCGLPLDCGGCSGGTVCGGDGRAGRCAPPQCDGRGWCWESPLPAGWDVTGLWAFGPRDVWATGGSILPGEGGVLHWNGESWSSAGPARAPGLNGIWASAPTDLWCPADDGSVWHFDGATWAPTVVAAGVAWGAVSGSGPADVWMVGIRGGNYGARVAHFDGVAWREHVLPVPARVALTSVLSRSPTDVWVAGQLTNDLSPGPGIETLPFVVHYDGSTWSVETLPPGGPKLALTTITQAGPSDVYFSSVHRTLHWDGAAFEWVDGNFSVVSAGGQGTWRVVQGGEAQLEQLVSGGWVPRAATPVTERVSSWHGFTQPWHLAGSANGDLWIGGQAGRLYHWNGAALTSRGPGLTTRNLKVVRGFGRHVWTAGGPEVLHFDGAKWSKSTLPFDVEDLWVPSSTRAWAVAGRWVVEHDGAQWLQRDVAASGVLHAIDGSGPADIWVAGEAGEVRRFDGTSWRRIETGTQRTLYDVAVVAPNDVWVSDGDGAVMHWDGSGWTSHTPGGASWRIRLLAFGAGDVWAVWHGAGLLRWNGASWSTVAASVSGTDLSGLGPADVWVGGLGPLNHFDGQAWSAEPMPHRVTSLWASPDTLWLVGDHGTVLRRAR